MRRVRGLSRISLSYNILPLFSADASIYVSFSPSYTCLTTWTLFDLTNIKKQAVNRIEFDFEGSDSGAYGLNTPAYVCIDDIRISRN